MFFIEVLAISSALYVGKKAYRKVQESERLRPFLNGTPGPQLEISDKDEDEVIMSSVENRTLAEQNQNVALSSISLGVASLGLLLYRPLLFASAVPALYTMLPLFKSAYQSISKEQRIQISTLDSVVLATYLTTGSFFALSVSTWAYHFARKSWLKAETQATDSYLAQYGANDQTAWIATQDTDVEIMQEQIVRGDIITVNSGERIPVDGVVTEGFGTVDEQHILGSTQSIDKVTGDIVYASTPLLYGQIFVRAEQIGASTVASQVGKIYSEAAMKTAIQTADEESSDNIARWRLALGALALPLLGSTAAVAIPMSYFGQNLGALTRLNELNFTQIASKQGILFRDRSVLMSLNKVNAVVFELDDSLLQQSSPGSGLTLQAEAQEVIDYLMKRAKAVYIVSNGSKVKTERWAKALGVKEYLFDQTTQTKADFIKQLKNKGRFVCFVGDGIQDKWAMKQADISISLCNLTGHGSSDEARTSSISANSADILLVKNSLEQFIQLFQISQRFTIKLLTNRFLTRLPGILYVGGAIFFHLGIPASMLLNYGGLALSTRNSILPLRRQQYDEEQIEQEIQPSLPLLGRR